MTLICTDNGDGKDNLPLSTFSVLLAIAAERQRQDDTWGVQRHLWPEWIAILTEEVGEAAHEAVEERWLPTGDLAALRTELVHVAAVAVQIIEHIDEVTT